MTIYSHLRKALPAAVCVIVAAVGLATTPLAAAETIEEMVNNSFALESPFWKYLYNNGYGYLDAQRVNNDGHIVCANRTAGVTAPQIVALLRSRGYTLPEAQGIVLAEQAASQSQISQVC